MANSKIGRPTKERVALIRGQVSSLLWNGYIETTLDRAKAVQRMAEKNITLAVNTYKDVVKVTKDRIDDKGKKIAMEVVNDGPQKLAARRKLMSFCYDLQEQRKPKEAKSVFIARTEDIKHPLIEKIFNVYAPRYAERAEKLGQAGGYTRIIKLGARRGDNAEMVRLELIVE